MNNDNNNNNNSLRTCTYTFVLYIHIRVKHVQNTALLGSARILRLVLTLLLFLHETSSVKNQCNDIKDKIEKKNGLFFQRVVFQCFVHGIFSSSGALLVLF